MPKSSQGLLQCIHGACARAAGKFAAAGIIACVLYLPPAVYAQTETDVLDTVVVTARKRTESLQDAPVAITAISQRQLEQYNITQMEDVASLAGGGVLISKNGVSPTISVRGVSSDSINAGFDQSVGIIIDGVFYDRSRWTQQGFFDMGQVEVLKGPQSLYFGKSTVAGAVVISTANPTNKFEAQTDLGYEFAAREKYVEGILSGPVSDTVGARLAVRAASAEGWLENQATPIRSDRFAGWRDYNGRFTLTWDPADDVHVNWKVQANDRSDDGPATQAQLYRCRGPSAAGTRVTGIPANTGMEYYPVTDDCQLDNKISVFPGPPGLGFGRPQNHTNAYLTSLKVDWKAGAFNFTSVTGANTYDLAEQTGYISSGGLITAWETEKNTAFSQELRALSNFDGPVNFLAGVDYQHTDFRFHNISQIILALPDPRNGRRSSQDHTAAQAANSASVFGEITWNITQELQLSGGARYTKERKNDDYTLPFVNENFQTIFGFPFWLPEGERLTYKFRDSNVSPQATLQWKPYQGMNLFASYKTGYLPGGFSLGATPQAGLALKDFLFDSEKVKGFEVGMKTELLNRTLSLDVTFYDYRYTNLQVNLYVPATASFVVGNAGEAITRGVELGARWQANDYLSLHGNATYNHGVFESYNTSCYTLQTAAQGCSPLTNTQDVSGNELPRSPKRTLSVGGLYSHPLTSAINWSVGADAYYSDTYNLEQTGNPYLTQPSYVRVDASFALEDAEGHWKAALFGRNLSNKAITSFGATRGFTNDNLAEIERLRTVNLQFTYKW